MATNKKEAQIRIYDDFYAELNDWNNEITGKTSSLFLTREPFEEVIHFLHWVQKKKETGRVLDIGCGAGRHSVLFAEAGYSVTGVDYSKEAIHLAQISSRERNLDIDFIHQNLFTFNPEKKFDIVIDIGCLHHIEPEMWADYKKVLNLVTKELSYILLIQFRKAPFQSKSKVYNFDKQHLSYYFSREELNGLFGEYTTEHQKTVLKSNVFFSVLYLVKGSSLR